LPILYVSLLPGQLQVDAFLKKLCTVMLVPGEQAKGGKK